MISNAALSSRFRAMKIPTPSVRVRDLLRGPLPKGTFLVCGQPDLRVNWARTADARNRAVEGDLILIGANTLQDPERDLTRLISELVPVHIRAIALQGTLDISALEAAARNDMVVLYLPADTTIDAVERAITLHIIELQKALKERDAALQQELARHINSNFGLQASVKTLGRILKLPVMLHDAQGFRLAHSVPEMTSDTTAYWQHHLAVLENRDLVAHFAERTTISHHDAMILESSRALSTAISVDSTIAGYLSILKANENFDEFTSLALSRGAVVCGMLMASSGILHSNRSARADWITAWLDGQPTDDPLLTMRAEQSAFDPDQVYVISTLRWLPDNELRRTLKPVRPEQLTEYVRQETHNRRINAIVSQYRDRTLLFLPLDKAQHTGRMKQYTVMIADRISEVLGGFVACGVGRPCQGLTSLRRSFAEAERAMNLTEQIWRNTRVNFFGDLSLSELLMYIGDHNQLRHFCHDWLASILEYDQQNNSDLLKTMTVYFANNGNMAATAKQLNVHRNTLVYRLNRVAEITQLDKDDADVQLNLHLAIKIHGLLKLLDLN